VRGSAGNDAAASRAARAGRAAGRPGRRPGRRGGAVAVRPGGPAPAVQLGGGPVGVVAHLGGLGVPAGAPGVGLGDGLLAGGEPGGGVLPGGAARCPACSRPGPVIARARARIAAAVVDADPQADPPWMATAYIPGPSLDAAVRRGGPLCLDRLRALGAALAEGLAAIHAAGLVHRDLLLHQWTGPPDRARAA
jgi:hypothetical protein